jgi:predicted esterase YcpF (UPF0227 family)|tara:strand:- start:164 stop:643 length:480 start_codon:yes stop_codon:yes gene_type:complete
MKKVLYLHGLESKQGGPKVKFLRTRCSVYAPSMDYRSNQLSENISKMEEFKPDLIIGSSMGGYLAHIMSKHLRVPAILFNPALHSRSFELKIDSSTISQGTGDIKQILLLGKKDNIIDPETTKKLLGNNHQYIIEEGEHAHRTPLDVFIGFYLKYEYLL